MLHCHAKGLETMLCLFMVGDFEEEYDVVMELSLLKENSAHSH